DQLVNGIDVTLGPDPVTSVDPATGDLQPGFEPARAIEDGVWPSAPVVVGAPFTVRRQRLVAVEIYPYRYDVATRRLWTRRSLTVRVSFSGGTTGGLSAQALPQEDRHWDPVFQDAVVNFDRGRRWRASAAPPAGSRLSGRISPTGALAAPTFDEDEPEVRVQIDSTGAWGLDFDELAAKGYPTGVP